MHQPLGIIRDRLFQVLPSISSLVRIPPSVPDINHHPLHNPVTFLSRILICHIPASLTPTQDFKEKRFSASLGSNTPNLDSQDVKLLPLLAQWLVSKGQTVTANAPLKRVIKP